MMEEEQPAEPAGGKAESLHRVKVYELSSGGDWDDKGTGFVCMEYLEASAVGREIGRLPRGLLTALGQGSGGDGAMRADGSPLAVARAASRVHGAHRDGRGEPA
jgi:hypothetical protein